MEALEKIEVIRGAASLQYGPQFGGLLNYRIKKRKSNKKRFLLKHNRLLVPLDYLIPTMLLVARTKKFPIMDFYITALQMDGEIIANTLLIQDIFL